MQPFLVSKYCANGNVMDFICEYPEVNRLLIVGNARHPVFSILTPSCQLHQVSSGMMYLHSQSIIHADLKAVRDSVRLSKQTNESDI